MLYKSFKSILFELLYIILYNTWYMELCRIMDIRIWYITMRTNESKIIHMYTIAVAVHLDICVETKR